MANKKFNPKQKKDRIALINACIELKLAAEKVKVAVREKALGLGIAVNVVNSVFNDTKAADMLYDCEEIEKKCCNKVKMPGKKPKENPVGAKGKTGLKATVVEEDEEINAQESVGELADEDNQHLETDSSGIFSLSSQDEDAMEVVTTPVKKPSSKAAKPATPKSANSTPFINKFKDLFPDN